MSILCDSFTVLLALENGMRTFSAPTEKEENTRKVYCKIKEYMDGLEYGVGCKQKQIHLAQRNPPDGRWVLLRGLGDRVLPKPDLFSNFLFLYLDQTEKIATLF